VRRFDPARLGLQLLAPVTALLFAGLLSSLALFAVDRSPAVAFPAMLRYASDADSLAEILNRATTYYLAAMAVAIGFRMGLFNIGVDGQYRLAALLSGALGGAAFFAPVPGPIRTVLIVLVAMVVGALWAGIAALLKVYRGVSEVISTIMLNFIGGSIVAYLIRLDNLGVQPAGSNQTSTRLLPEDSWAPSLPLIPEAAAGVNSLILLAAAVGLSYWFILGRTRFGFDLRASGLNPSAAVASGVDAKRMVIYAMLLSGAVAGLTGMPQLLGEVHAFTPQEFGGAGFIGIGIALLGRNHPIGVAAAALLWAALDRSAIILDLEEIPKEIVTIMQGVVVLAVVVAYELANRVSRRVQQRRVGAAVAGDGGGAAGTPAPQPQPTAAVAASPTAEHRGGPAGDPVRNDEERA
jgi:simple sugar transport system permease protein